jgi:hypothetical protein
MIATIDDRLPAILPLDAYDRWLWSAESERSACALPSDLMRMWPIEQGEFAAE